MYIRLLFNAEKIDCSWCAYNCGFDQKMVLFNGKLAGKTG